MTTCVIVGELATENTAAFGLLRAWSLLKHRCIIVRREQAAHNHSLARDASDVISTSAPIESEEAHTEVMAALRRIDTPISVVFPGAEYGVVLAARLGTTLGVRANSPEVGLVLRRKNQQREIATRAGLSVPGYKVIWTGDELEEACRLSTYPVVLKPSDGAGKMGVSLAQNAEELRHNYYRDAPRMNERQAQLPIGSCWLVEEYVPGRKLSVDLFIADGSVVPVAVSEARIMGDRFIEVGHVVPADLTSTRLETVFDHATRIVRTLGVTAGVVHLELIERDDGELIFLEANGRLPGGGVPRLAFEASGNSYYQMVLEMLLSGKIPEPKPFRQAVAVHWFLRGSGRVHAVHGWEELDRTPGFIAKHIEFAPGALHRQSDDGYDRVGYSMNAGPTPALPRAAAAPAAGLVSIEYEAAPEPGSRG